MSANSTNDNNTNNGNQVSREEVFRLKTKGRNCILKHKGTVTSDQLLGDEPVELDKVQRDEYSTSRNMCHVGDHNDYTVNARFYRSNIVASYLVHKSNYPYMFVSVDYESNMTKGGLFQLYVNYRMNDETKKSITNLLDFKDKFFYGTWNTCFDADDEFNELWEDKLKNMLLENLDLNDVNLLSYLEDNSLEVNSINDEVINGYIENEMKWYNNVVNPQKFMFMTNNRTRDYLYNIMKDPRIMNLVKIALECRVINRRNQMGLSDDDEYVVPEVVANLTDISKQLEEDDMLVEWDSDE